MIIKAMIFGSIMGFLIYGLRKAIWKDSVPEKISKYRWPIGIVLMIIGVTICTRLELNHQITTWVGACLLFSVGWVLKNTEEKNDDSGIEKSKMNELTKS